MREQALTKPSDHNLTYLYNSIFTPIDMTDYEETFVGEQELANGVPMENPRMAFMRDPDKFPMTMKPAGIVDRTQRVLSRTAALHELMTYEEEADEPEEGEEEEEADEEEEGEEEEEVEEEAEVEEPEIISPSG
jgi:hypothetical protein